MPYILDDTEVNQSVYGNVAVPTKLRKPKQLSDTPAADASARPRKFSRSRHSPANRAERYLQELRHELIQDSVVSVRVSQIEEKVRHRTMYTPKAKPRKSSKTTVATFGVS